MSSSIWDLRRLGVRLNFEPGTSLADHIGLFQDEAVDAAAELVRLGKERWDTERQPRLAGEAVIGRPCDTATMLPDEVIEATPEIPWREVKGVRIIAAHAEPARARHT